MLSIYFFLKSNNYDKTAETLYKELNFDKIFSFPDSNNSKISISNNMEEAFNMHFFQNILLNYVKNEHEEANKQGENNNNMNTNCTNSFLSDYWKQFWNLFCRKIENSNSFISPLDEFLKNSDVVLTYNIDTLHLNNNMNNTSSSINNKSSKN